MQAATPADSPAATANMTILPLSMITAVHNPRKYFDPNEMDELAESIRANGILQPILVRPTSEGSYAIVAGERRYRAARKVFGDTGHIPAVVREMSEEEAEAAALVENTQRADMSVTEEAVAAGKVLAKRGGNRDEAAAALGWPMSKLNRRLALLNLTEEVMNSLNERSIMVGHAELLAAVPQEKQGKALANIIGKNLSVQKVRDMLSTASTEFARAIFNLSSCAECQHNSNLQATLFASSVDAGRCTNSDCFKAKTAERIAAIKSEAEEEYPNVRLIEVGDPANYVPLAASGNLGVGDEQFAACKGCSNHGATVSAIPGSEGKIERGICFDSTCHQKKVAARIKADKTSAGEGKQKVSPAAKTGSAKAKGEKKAVASSLSEKVKEYRRKRVWNAAAENELRIQHIKASSFLLDLLLTGNGSKINNSALADVFNGMVGEKVYSHSSKGQPDQPHALPTDQKRLLITEAAASAVTAIEEDRVKGLLSFLEADLGKHWAVNEEFLTLLTKSEIESVCVNIGLAAAMPDFKKVIGGKKDEAVKAIMASGFDFTGKIPTMLVYASEQQ